MDSEITHPTFVPGESTAAQPSISAGKPSRCDSLFLLGTELPELPKVSSEFGSLTQGNLPFPDASYGAPMDRSDSNQLPSFEPPTMWYPRDTPVVNGPDEVDAVTPELSCGTPSDASTDEIALYDRQIRLWGMKAQEKIRNAKILLITMSSLSAEIAKNLVLAGIHTLTILDHKIVTEADLGAQFFLTADDIGKNRAAASAPNIRKLNPRVNVVVDESDIKLKKAGLVEDYDLVIATGLSPSPLAMINTATRLHNKPFYAAGTHGFYGFIFSDLIQHEFIVEREKGNRPTVLEAESRTRSIIDVKVKRENGKNIEMVKKREVYSTWMLASDGSMLPDEFLKSRRRLKNVTPILSCLRALWEYQAEGKTDGAPDPDSMEDHKTFTQVAMKKHKLLGLPEETLKSETIRRFIQNVNGEIAPVCAILGGQLAQDVINVLGGRLQPIQNFVIMDGEHMEAPVYALHPPGDLGNDLFPETEKAIARRLSAPQMTEAVVI